MAQFLTVLSGTVNKTMRRYGVSLCITRHYMNADVCQRWKICPSLNYLIRGDFVKLGEVLEIFYYPKFGISNIRIVEIQSESNLYVGQASYVPPDVSGRELAGIEPDWWGYDYCCITFYVK